MCVCDTKVVLNALLSQMKAKIEKKAIVSTRMKTYFKLSGALASMCLCENCWRDKVLRRVNSWQYKKKIHKRQISVRARLKLNGKKFYLNSIFVFYGNERTLLFFVTLKCCLYRDNARKTLLIVFPFRLKRAKPKDGLKMFILKVRNRLEVTQFFFSARLMVKKNVQSSKNK